MKMLVYAAASLVMSGTAIAVATPAAGQTSSAMQNPNGALPPGDGITALGHDPEGQAFTPPGFNTGMSTMAYPPVTAAPAGLIGATYPVCSSRVTDRCVQAYTKLARSR